eukprot:TRINITY_DN3662_c0_g1_i8.p1 TRINITY_DN3662_c0_g1~~TRINITY_DN3662_c0_g1_i8.p1  ORF type:complete len:445 (+),score=81.79 TRINITY_DN3662_c0_g1_i8:50-1384(+)
MADVASPQKGLFFQPLAATADQEDLPERDRASLSQSLHAMTFSSLLAEGEMLFKLADYARAIQSFTKALDIKQDDRTVLVNLSKCHMLLGRSEQSLKDANRALQSDKSCFRAILQKAEAHFAAGDFEQALVYFHRGYQIRCDVDEFRLGVQKSQEAIMEAIFGGHDQESDSNQTTASAPQITIEDHTSVQSQVTKPITTASMTIKGRSQMQISQATLSEVKEGRVPVPPSTVQNFDKRPLRSRRTLGRLSDDKQFLEELAKNADLGKKGSVGKIAEMGVVYLNKREGFWKQQVTKSSSAPLPSTIRVSSPFRTDRLKQSDSSSSHNVDPPTLRGTAQHSGVASMIPLKGASILPPISSSSAKPAEITTPKSTEQEQLTTQFKGKFVRGMIMMPIIQYVLLIVRFVRCVSGKSSIVDSKSSFMQFYSSRKQKTLPLDISFRQINK